MDRTTIYRLLFPSSDVAGRRQAQRESDLNDFLVRGQPAVAEVIGATPTRWYKSSGGLRTRRRWALELRVPTSDGASFDVSIKHAFLLYYAPIVGQQLGVLYDPDDLGSVIVRPEDPEPAPANLGGDGRGDR